MKPKELLLSKIKSKEATICVIGLGYVGLPLAILFASKGFKTIGLDIDQDKVHKLIEKESYISTISNSTLEKQVESGNLLPTSNPKSLMDCDCILICVPTPIDKNRQPNLKFVKETAQIIKNYRKPGTLISLESTTYPGTTEEVLIPFIASTEEIGRDYFFVHAPEREDPGNPEYNSSQIPRIIGGATKDCLEIGEALYKSIVPYVHPVSSLKVAEMTKLIENIHRAVNIGLVNELKLLADAMNIDIFEVIKAASTKPFGFVPYYPGPGIGGHCLPVDPFYLTWKAYEYGIHMRFVELAGEINASMASFVTNKVIDTLNSIGKPLSKSKILILGVTYKKNVDDLRMSPALTIIEKLMNKGGKVDFYDPFSLEIKINEKTLCGLDNITVNLIRNFDVVVLLTDHDNLPYELILENSMCLIDTRGKFNTATNVIRG